MLEAIKERRETNGEPDVNQESFTSKLLATRRSEIAAFAIAVRNDNLVKHVQSQEGDETFTEIIRLAVLGYGVSQKELAQAVGQSVATVSRWVSGNSKAPRLSRGPILGAIGELIDHDLDVDVSRS
jgi:ribosome-binding protein aMBF1 (putative translation factor)